MTHLKSCTRISGFIEITIERKLPIEIHFAYIATIYHLETFLLGMVRPKNLPSVSEHNDLPAQI